jgi:uncharacterized protein (DUF58 family)
VNAWLTALRPALSGLTTRGRSFLSAGGACALCAIILGQTDLMRVAVLLAALPLGCAVMLTRARHRLGLTRTVHPVRVTAGESVRVRLELHNLARIGTRVLLAEDRVPYVLGAPPRFVLDRLPGGQQAAVTYSLRSEMRGRYPVGPLRLRVADPFGMCELTRSFTATDPVIVIPRLWPLAAVNGGGLWAGTGDSTTRAAAVSGEDDIATREYRNGDDLRRVHWRSTAKRGELMVRREEQPRQMRATVLLDTRYNGHRGEGPASSFEWAVSAAASAAVHFAGQGYGVRMLLDDRPASWTSPHSGEASGVLLDAMATVGMGEDPALPDAVAQLRRGGGDGIVVAVLGEVGEDEANALARLGREGVPGVALLLRTTAWTALPPGRAAEFDEQRAKAAAILRQADWRVAEAGPELTVTQAWDQAIGRRQDPGRTVSSARPAPAAPSVASA